MKAGMLHVCTYDNYFVFPSQLVLIKLISRTALSTARAALLQDTKASWVLNHEYTHVTQSATTHTELCISTNFLRCEPFR